MVNNSADDTTLLLIWDQDSQQFNPISEKSSGIYLEYQGTKGIWLFSYSEDSSLIARRTALRRANEIAKVGIEHPVSHKRIGVGFRCEEDKDPYHNLPSKVTRAEHDYNK